MDKNRFGYYYECYKDRGSTLEIKVLHVLNGTKRYDMITRCCGDSEKFISCLGVCKTIVKMIKDELDYSGEDFIDEYLKNVWNVTSSNSGAFEWKCSCGYTLKTTYDYNIIDLDLKSIIDMWITAFPKEVLYTFSCHFLEECSYP